MVFKFIEIVPKIYHTVPNSQHIYITLASRYQRNIW